MDDREKREIEKYKLDEEIRLDNFKRVKEMYKRGSVFGRISRKMQGKAPDWKAIENYSSESLEYLADVRRGDTFLQKKQVYDYNKSHKDPYSDDMLSEKRFNKFVSELMKSEKQLKDDIELNRRLSLESFEKYGINVYR